MYEFTEKIVIQAPPARVWEVMRDVESWWPASKPEHKSITGTGHGDGEAIGSWSSVTLRSGWSWS